MLLAVRPLAQARGLVAEYLFVLARDAVTSVSADYVLRTAVALQRRRQRVIVVLADDAASKARNGQLHPAVRALLEAGGRVLLLAGLGDEITPIGVEAASEDYLASLVLMPGIQAQWC